MLVGKMIESSRIVDICKSLQLAGMLEKSVLVLISRLDLCLMGNFFVVL